MDVSIAVSLMRGQMGTVIERAVNTAVETVLAEMLKVVGVKFEELKKEMSTVKREMVAVKREKAVKEKENEDIKGRLQLSEIRLKYLKQSLSGMVSKEDRRVSPCQKTAYVRSETLTVPGLSVPSAASVAGRDDGNGGNTTKGIYQLQNRVTQPPDSSLATSFDNLQENHSQDVDGSASNVSVVNGSLEDQEPEEITRPLDGAASLRKDEECESDQWTSKQATETPTAIQGSCDQTESALGSTLASRGSFRPHVKEEEEEVEVICIKEEPQEVASLLLDCERLAQGSQEDWRGPSQDNRNFIDHTPFSSTSSDTYSLSQPAMSVSVSTAQRQVRAWPKDLSLYEEYKLRRAELRRHSLNRRREMEKSLPQPLLADLVRERREKTRLRVARWRAKRKLQACLMNQSAQVTSAGPAQALNTQSQAPAVTTQQRNNTVPSYGSLLFNRTHCNSALAYPGSLQLNSSPSSSLLLGHSLVETVNHAAVTSTSSSSSQAQPGLSWTDSEIF
ncbi:uncharacterized protein LOC134017310 isoform X2 [Osmerus eperlanus]|uniref:uncharacterized protein LOC134017310 isoform X2 n=1 Tax=Osmerus eperlanus TaxID=29151 RepID=UPI002E15AD5A